MSLGVGVQEQECRIGEKEWKCRRVEVGVGAGICPEPEMSKMGGSAKPDKDNPDPQAIMTLDENRAEGHIPNVLLATLTKQYCAEIIQVPTDQGGVWNFFLSD